MITTVNHTHPRVAAAIKFVEGEILTAITNGPPDTYLYTTFEPRPWVHYIVAFDDADVRERKDLIEKYGNATPQQLEYYIYYHGCYEFAVFYWTVLSVAGKSPIIAEQLRPFPHCYFIVDGEVVDPILHYTSASYPYGVSPPMLHRTPHDLFVPFYGTELDRHDWEKAQIEALKLLE